LGFISDRIAFRPIKDESASFDLAFCFREPVSNPALEQFLKTIAESKAHSRLDAGAGQE
jgi:hypothetical protein